MFDFRKLVIILDFVIYGAILSIVYMSGVAISFKVKGLSVTESVMLVMLYLFVVGIIVHFIEKDKYRNKQK